MLIENPKFFGRRIGRKIRKTKSHLLEKFLPRIQFKDIEELQNRFSKIYLEIGFGDGEHLAGMAKNNSDTGFIGAEVFQNGVANLLNLLTGIKETKDIPEDINLCDGRVDNVRVFSDDVRLLFEKIPNNSIDKIFLLFPDPWPKKRHEERRFVNKNNLEELSRILKPGGILQIATDHPVYKRWTLSQLRNHKHFIWTASCGTDWKKPPADWVETKYQRKAIREGRRPIFLEYKKI